MKDFHIPKKFYLVLLIFALAMIILGMFASCAPHPESATGMQRTQREHPETMVTYECQYCHKEHHLFYNKFVLKGHHYIVFYDQLGYKGFVHDPDCPCHRPINPTYSTPILHDDKTEKSDNEYDFLF